MRNIVEKITTLRTAEASGCLKMRPETVVRLKQNDLPKQDVLPIARAAAVMAAKKTPDIIPYCHQIALDHVDVDFKIGVDTVEVRATVTCVGRTGVEMEALMAASVATLTVYDMLKPVDKDIEILETRLERKKGGKSDYVEKIPAGFKASVIVTSDGTSQGHREDKSGKIIRERLTALGIETVDYTILPDEKDQIVRKLLADTEKGVDLIVTTGGTGLGPRDVTVEATAAVIEREIPGVMEAARAYGQRRTPYAMLSRGLAGTRGKTIIVNMPGSSRGTEESLNAVFPAVLHSYGMMRGGGH